MASIQEPVESIYVVMLQVANNKIYLFRIKAEYCVSLNNIPTVHVDWTPAKGVADTDILCLPNQKK